MSLTSAPARTSAQIRIGRNILPLLGICVGIVALFHYFSLRHSLWEDELIALTHTFQPLPTFVIEVLRNDIHPFFYFLVLKGWMLLSPGSGFWALASSFAFTLVSALVVYRVGRSAGGNSAALWATAIFLLLPTTAWGAGNLRMYGLLPALVVGVWYLNVRFLRQPSRWGGAALVLLEVCTAYVHAIEFIFVAFIVLAVAIDQFKATPAKTFRNWIFLQIPAGMTMLPLPLSALVRGTEPLPPSSWDSFVTIFGQVVAGGGGAGIRMVTLAGLAVFVALVYFSMQSKRWRVTVLALPVAMLLLAYIIGFLGKPIFKSPVFSANLLPFLALGAGAGIAHVMEQARRLPAAMAATFTVALAATTLPWSGSMLPQESYQAAAAYVKQNAAPGDIVIVPHLSVFWGVMFYAEGAGWGQPLAVRPADNPQWRKLTAKLGNELSTALSLYPGKPYVEFGGIRYCVGTDFSACASGAKRAWVVNRRTYDNGVDFDRPMTVVKSDYINELAVSQLEQADQGEKRFENPFLLRDPSAKGQPTSY